MTSNDPTNRSIANDPPTEPVTTTEDDASLKAERSLAAQRRKHQTRDSAQIDNTGVGALVNNTGLDGDAASG